MRVINFNCQNIYHAFDRGLKEWLIQQDADIVCLQDTRIDQKQFQNDQSLSLPNYYGYAFGGYNRIDRGGIVIYTKVIPKAALLGVGNPCIDEQGRYLQVDFDDLSVVSLYVPEEDAASGVNLKYNFLENYSQILRKQERKRRSFIITGTWNIAHRDIDSALLVNRWKHRPENSRALKEQHWMEALLGNGHYADAYRVVEQNETTYTWWPNEENKNKNIGSRIDYQIISHDLKAYVINVSVYLKKSFSDHAPVMIDYDWDLKEGKAKKKIFDFTDND